MSKTRLSLRKAKYNSCESENELRAVLISEGYSIFPWQDGPGASYVPHHHPHDEFIVVQSGSIVFKVDGKDIRVEPGDMLVMPEGTQHSAVNDSENPVRYYICSKH